ncbi:MAG: M28 family peptidase [Armatimonadetes bacterium]|nr:M28 family peptidase [Armatimonadota bacterium]
MIMNAILAAAVLAWAPSAPAPAAANVITADSLMAHVKFLSSDALEGRLTGSPGERAAGDYAMKWFQDHGLLPAGVGGTYFQEFPVTFGGRAGDNNRLSFTLSTGTRIEAETGKEFNPLYNSDYKRLVEADVVFAGEGLVTGERDDYSLIDVTGKVVIVIPSPEQRGASRNRAKATAAKEKGAVGIIFAGPVQDDGPPLMSLNRRYALSRDTGLVALSITPELFEKVSGLNYASARTQAKAGRVMPGFARGVSAAMQAEIVPIQASGRNVIAMLPGNDPVLKRQYIVFGAHVDHLGGGAFGSLSGRGEIHNGADDNASGTATILELARYFAEEKSNRRTLVFQLYSGEELGLRGSTNFVSNPTIDLNAVTCMFNVDMVGNLTDNKITIDGIRSSPAWNEMVNDLASGFAVDRDPQGRGSVSGRSDHAAWERSGIPVLFFFTGFHDRYHRPTDDWDLLNYAGMARVATLAAKFIERVDGMDEMLAFKKGDTVMKRGAPEVEEQAGEEGTRRIRVGLVPEYDAEGPGMLLAGVTDDSPAEKAGLKAGDRIIKWGEFKIEDVYDIQVIFEESEPGKPVEVTILRDGKEMTVTVVPEPPRK